MYSVRLLDAVREWTVSEILDLIVWLPADSAFRAEYADGPEFGMKHWLWDQNKELMTGLLNLVNYQTYVIAQSNSQKKIPVPDKIESPVGQTPRKVPRRGDADQHARAMLASLKAMKKG